jgi:DNA (cytosine-5)-methyltransferase 1
VFIMENVKGLLTSSVGGASMFEAIQADLANPTATFSGSSTRSPAAKRYVLLPIHVMPGELRTPDLVLADPSRYVLQCEQHGVPQARHRVIVMGVREDIFSASVHRVPGLEMTTAPATALDALSGLPAIRSGISRQPDCPWAWYEALQRSGQYVTSVAQRSYPEVAEFLRGYAPKKNLDRAATRYRGQSLGLAENLRIEGLDLVLNHESRSHMEGDLRRYLFAAAFNQVYASSPLSADFPSRLAPKHANWTGGTFADRFRVQSSSRPASTVTSHLSKDGHAFIHWDHRQCRSISVREAARLQTFPDDYLFLGSRTEQFVQVGNAVPPLAARQIARVVWDVLTA